VLRKKHAAGDALLSGGMGAPAAAPGSISDVKSRRSDFGQAPIPMSGAAGLAGKPAEPGGNSHNSDPTAGTDVFAA